ncbi:MAG: hypothetical protein V9F00_17520 [Nocardioides sp.]
MLTQPRVWSQLDPASAMGAKTIAMSSSALRMRRLIHTMHGGADGEAGDEHREDRASAWRRDVESQQAAREERDPVAHLLHVGSGGVDDADAESGR